jgi:hypothetical protein
MRTPKTAVLLAFLLLACGAPTSRAEDGAKPPPPTDEERAEVRRLVDELRGQASRIRGLAWKKDVPADLLSRDQMIEHFLKDLDEEYPPERRARDAKILRRLGMLQPGEDVVELMIDMLRDNVQGFYDPKTDRLYLIQGVSPQAQKPSILHELIHALEDQYYDLYARVKPLEDDDPDRFFAEKCVGEGSAEHARMLYEKDDPEAAKRAQQETMTEATARAQMAMFARVPAYMIVQTFLQYDMGPKLVESFVKDDYATRMNRLWDEPPTTQEQCMHPEKWVGPKRDLPRRVVWGGDLAAAAGEGWKKLHEIAVGELDLALFLDCHLGGRKGRIDLPAFASGLWANPGATKAARGWDAGRDVYLEKEGLPLGYVSALAFDTPRDAAEAAEAFEKVMRAMYATAEPGAWTVLERRRRLDWTSERGKGSLVLHGDETRAAEAVERSLREMYGDTFRGTWTDLETRRIDWTSANGAGRMMLRGDEVIVADGFPAERLDGLWAVAEKTRFERQAGDAYPPE